MVCFKVNDRQYVEVSPELKTETEDRLIRIGFETADARKLRDYLASKGVAVPAKIGKDPNGNLSFEVKDPDGHSVQFIQYMPGSLHSRNFGKHLPDTRLSDHILHVGVWVTDPVRADSFYKDILGFRLQWKGGRTDSISTGSRCWFPKATTGWNTWYRRPGRRPSSSARCITIVSARWISKRSIETVVERGYQPPRQPAIGRDGRWLLQLFDKNYTRTEIMVRKPVETPCCSPLKDDI